MFADKGKSKTGARCARSFSPSAGEHGKLAHTKMKTQVDTQGNYKLELSGESRSKQAGRLAAFLSPGKAGECIVRQGLTNDSWALFLTRIVTRCLDVGKGEEEIARILVEVGAGNISAARQAMNSIDFVQGEGESALRVVLDEVVTKQKSALSVAGIVV